MRISDVCEGIMWPACIMQPPLSLVPASFTIERKESEGELNCRQHYIAFVPVDV